MEDFHNFALGESLLVCDNVLVLLRYRFGMVVLLHTVKDDERAARLEKLGEELRRISYRCEVVVCEGALLDMIEMFPSISGQNTYKNNIETSIVELVFCSLQLSVNSTQLLGCDAFLGSACIQLFELQGWYMSAVR